MDHAKSIVVDSGSRPLILKAFRSPASECVKYWYHSGANCVYADAGTVCMQ